MTADHDDLSTPRWHGYMEIVVTCSRGRRIAHLLEFSRLGGTFAIDGELPHGEHIVIEIDVDRRYEQLMDAPDILVFPAVVAFAPDEGEHFIDDQVTFAFERDTILRYWPWLDTLAPHHGMRRDGGAPVPHLP